MSPLFSFAQQSNQYNSKWSESEHFELGEVGAQAACLELGLLAKDCPIKNILRADGKIAFRYGDLVAAADFYDKPMQLNFDRARGIANIIRCVHAATNNLPIPTTITNDGSNCQITGILSRPGYLEVLTKNYSHFGWNSMVAYVENHQIALNKAQESFLMRKQNPNLSQQLLHEALIYNSFADHYLTDAFSSGHIRVPRIQIKKWAFENLKGAFRTVRGDLLSLLIHDHESRHLKTGDERGMLVKNSLDHVWMTYSDGQMHADKSSARANDAAFMMPMMALKQSFKEIMVSWQTGQTPDGVFAATQYVPFSSDVPLVVKFSPEYQKIRHKEILRLVYAAVPFLEGLWFKKTDLERMLNSLSDIFLKFQADVTVEVQNNSELQLRLPAAYIDAYKKVD